MKTRIDQQLWRPLQSFFSTWPHSRSVITLAAIERGKKKQADMQSTVSSAIGCGNRRKPCPDLQLPPWKHSTTHDSRPLQNKNFENLNIQLGYQNDHSDNRSNLFQAIKLSIAIYVHTMRRHRAMSQIQQYLNAEQYYFGNKANWMLTVCFNYS